VNGGKAPSAVVHSSAVELIMRIIVGLLYMEQRPLPFVLAGDMGGRLFHGARAKRCLPAAQRGELAIVHSFVFLYFWVAGGGEWSLDRICKPASTSAVSPSPA
jgi:putative oxidoreductase